MLARYKWLEAATAKIRFGPDRRAVGKELEDHITDLREHYAGTGLDGEAAEAAALEAMGDPRAIAEELGRLHRPWLGYLWRMSQFVLALTALVCCLLAGKQLLSSMTLPETQYLTWETAASWCRGANECTDERTYPAGASVTTGGFTVSVDRAVMRQYDSGVRILRIDMCAGRNWRGEEPDMWAILTGVRDSGGKTYDGTFGDTDFLYGFRPSSSIWPKDLPVFYLLDVPEDVKWVELDVGHGSLTRTLRVDLTEEAAS